MNKIQAVQGEAREFAVQINEKLDALTDAVLSLDREVADDTQAVIHSHTTASDSEVTLPVLEIPAGAHWHVSRITVVSPSNLVPILYMRNVDNMNVLETPFARNDDTSPTVFSFRSGYVLRGPMNLYAHASGDSGDEFFGLAVVTMLGGYGR